mmetsp:Transcript_17764/g.44003  ORF Transcript_17764/g.44003 Transcript_17764/m.44003 type:complete len:288 (+) Transcript_17764:109-972(+)
MVPSRTNVEMSPTIAARPFHRSAMGPNPMRPSFRGSSRPGRPEQSTAWGSHRYCRPPFARGSVRYLAMPSPSSGPDAVLRSAITAGARVAAMIVVTMAGDTPCVRLKASWVVKLLPVATSTRAAEKKPSMATRPLTVSGRQPSTPNMSMESALNARSRRPVPAGPGPGPARRLSFARTFSSSISAQSFFDNRSGPRWSRSHCSRWSSTCCCGSRSGCGAAAAASTAAPPVAGCCCCSGCSRRAFLLFSRRPMATICIPARPPPGRLPLAPAGPPETPVTRAAPHGAN